MTVTFKLASCDSSHASSRVACCMAPLRLLTHCAPTMTSPLRRTPLEARSAQSKHTSVAQLAFVTGFVHGASEVANASWAHISPQSWSANAPTRRHAWLVQRAPTCETYPSQCPRQTIWVTTCAMPGPKRNAWQWRDATCPPRALPRQKQQIAIRHNVLRDVRAGIPVTRGWARWLVRMNTANLAFGEDLVSAPLSTRY